MCVHGGVCHLWGCKYKRVAQLCFTERMAQREPIYKIKSFLSVSQDERIWIIFQIKGTSFHLKSILFCRTNGNSHFSDIAVMLQRKYYTCFSLLTIQLQLHCYCSALYETGDWLLIWSEESMWDVNIEWWNSSLEHAKINISMPSNLGFGNQAWNSSTAQYSFQKIECSREKQCVSGEDCQSLSVSILWATFLSVSPQISPWSMMTAAKS